VSLWVAAVILMLSAAAYQRLTGPTRSLRGEFAVSGVMYRYRLIRSEFSTTDARVTIPDPGAGVSGQLHYRRYNTGDDFAAVPLEREGGVLAAALPAQPAAGKLEYYLTLDVADGAVRIPSSPDDDVIIRFKDPTPLAVLLPHVIMMFFAVLIGMRAGLGALVAPRGTGRLVWITLAFMTIGGMILGPIVQKMAFGQYWTGFPFGWDLTDNKTLIMWLVWVMAALGLSLKWKEDDLRARSLVFVAAVVMTVVYLIPHSLRGSELDYDALDAGVSASEAVDSGRGP